MAGHSKWANIKHKKGRSDAKRGKVFSRIAKEIISAAKTGGEDPKANPRLRLALQKARAANMPNEVIERNIKKASQADQADFIEMTYELYGHGGVGIIAEVMTDNKNRISSEMRIATNKKGGNVATPGAVAYHFDRKGILQIPAKDHKEDELFAQVIDAGAEDFVLSEDTYIVTTDPQELFQIKEALQEAGIEAEEASLEMIPKVTVPCDAETAASNLALIEWIEELDDVDAVYHNMEQ